MKKRGRVYTELRQGIACYHRRAPRLKRARLSWRPGPSALASGLEAIRWGKIIFEIEDAAGAC